MPKKSTAASILDHVSPAAEDEILDAYSHVLESADSPDVVLADLPRIFAALHIPTCYTHDISEAIGWYYDTKRGAIEQSPKWPVLLLLLRRLTISAFSGGRFDASDVVDIDKLVLFTARYMVYRDNSDKIHDGWALFVLACGKRPAENTVLSITDLLRVKTQLGFGDLLDSILIDMLACGRFDGSGRLLDFTLASQELAVGIRAFAEILGQIGELL